MQKNCCCSPSFTMAIATVVLRETGQPKYRGPAPHHSKTRNIS